MAYNDYGPSEFIDEALDPFAEGNDDRMKTTEKPQTEKPEITIKFGRGLVEDQFTSAKSGKEMSRIMIPNKDPEDRRAWETFVVPSNMVHDNQFGKGVWMKLPEEGTTKLSRPVLEGQDETGKNVWGTETRTVSNTELKSMMEAYKDKNRDEERSGNDEKKGSVLSDLGEKKEKAAEDAKDAPKKEHKSKDKDAR